ncbi:MAG: hypothetical protein HFH26_11570 [Clostridiaceae bacterium]|nr:hypothetical protein [Clostridiaceae bacterium]
MIETLLCEHGELFVESAGQRFPLSKFTGHIEIMERTSFTLILDTVQKSTKKGR